ncbi:MAG: hypothetical protein F6K11_28255 [Leptolyngbya sp. SIO3F4]|nr:hypothetical protein [Leptolyngbya sp. SIO3F4]
MPTIYPTKITYRLPSDAAKALYKIAMSKDLSPHQTAKDMLIEHMDTLEVLGLLETLLEGIEEATHNQTALEDRLKALELGFIETFSIIVAKLENVDRKDARTWIKSKFNNDSD